MATPRLTIRNWQNEASPPINAAYLNELDDEVRFQQTVDEALEQSINNLSLIIQDIGSNVLNAITLPDINALLSYTGDGFIIVEDIVRGGNFVSKTVLEIDPNTGSLYAVNDGTVFAKLGGGFWVRQYNGAINVKWFDAKGDGLTDDTVPIQKAINYGKVIYAPIGTYLLATQNAYRDGVLYGVGGLILKSGMVMYGDGDQTIFKVKDNTYGAGALYGILRSDYVSDIEIYNIKFDGNKINQVASTQCSNVYLHAGDNVYIHDCYSINANGQAIQVVGKSTDPIYFLFIENNIVDGASSIGIQVSHCNLPIIENNIVINCTNNAIDIYNEDGDTVPSGKGGTISGNSIDTALTGVFIETSSYINVSDNSIEDCSSAGIHINRINGQPSNSNISGNIISGGAYSIRISGVGTNNFVHGNTMSNFTTAAILLYGASCAGVTIRGNILTFLTATTYFIERNNTAISNVQILDNNANSTYGGIDYKILTTGTVSQSGSFIQNPIESNNSVFKDIYSLNLPITNGQTLNIVIQPNIIGILHLWGTSGGSWYSMATYTVMSDSTTAKVVKINDTFIATGQLFGAITVSGLTLNLPTSSTGSGGSVKFLLEYM